MKFDDRHVLVTGGAGFIGSHLSRHLIERGATVHVIDDLAAGREEYVPKKGEFDVVDIRSDECRKIIRDTDPDEIVHLAARHYIPFCNANPEETYNVNVMGTRNLLEVAQEVDLDRFVFASTGAVYPPDRAVHTENDSVGPDDIYGRTKLVGEDLVRFFHHESGVASVSVRLFNTYGPNETNEHLIPAILEQIEDSSRELELGNLSPRRDFIHVSDVTRAIVRILETVNDGYQTYNIGSGAAHSVQEVVELTAEALGEPLRIAQDEDRVRESDRPHLEADISRAKARLDWEPQVDFVEGLRELFEEYDVADVAESDTLPFETDARGG